MKKCPFCAEEIQHEAIKCRYCGEFLHKQEPRLPLGSAHSERKKQCPHCKEQIKDGATKCPHCGETVLSAAEGCLILGLGLPGALIIGFIVLILIIALLSGGC